MWRYFLQAIIYTHSIWVVKSKLSCIVHRYSKLHTSLLVTAVALHHGCEQRRYLYQTHTCLLHKMVRFKTWQLTCHDFFSVPSWPLRMWSSIISGPWDSMQAQIRGLKKQCFPCHTFAGNWIGYQLSAILAKSIGLTIRNVSAHILTVLQAILSSLKLNFGCWYTLK